MSSPASRTADVVAAVRAGLDRPISPTGDADACRLLAGPAGGRRPGPGSGGSAPWLDAHVAARTRFIDQRVAASQADGVGQLVLVGAGFDDRGLRFAAPWVVAYELDRPAAQAEKRRRLSRRPAGGPTPTFVPVDLATGDVDRALAAADHRADRPSIVVIEGVLLYVTADAVNDLLRVLAARSSPGSRLLATLAVHPPGLDSDTVVRAANARRRQGEAEPWRTILPAVEHLALVVRAGWCVDEVLDDADVAAGARRGWSRLVSAHPRHGLTSYA